MNTRYRLLLVIALALLVSVIGYAPAMAQGTTYTVQEGDTLYSIAVRNGTTPEYLMTLNGLSGPLIYVGQVIVVSGAPAPAPAPPVTGAGNHTVQPGDTLFNIAYRYNMTVDALKALNGLYSDIIYIGQVLRVSVASPAPAPAPSTGGARHTVVLGDTLTAIALRYGSSIDAIKSANGLATDFIYIGQTLVIPGGAAPAPAPQLAPQPPVYYYVQVGDSLGRIAELHGVSVGALAQLNNVKVTDWVYVGQRLLIPSGIYTPAPPAHPAPAPTPRPVAPATTATPRPRPTATPNNAPPYAPPATPDNSPPVVTRVWTAEIVENNCTRKDTRAVSSVVRITVEGKVGQGVDLYAKPKQPGNYLTFVITGTKPELGPTGAEIAPLRAGDYVLSAPGLADIGFYVDGTCSISINFKQVPK